MSDLPVPDHNGPRDPATPLARLAQEVRACRVCAAHLPLGPRPILRVDEGLRVLITGQAPGTRVHATGLPWNDPSGERLRDWLGVDRDRFYDLGRFGVMAMGFCYPAGAGTCRRGRNARRSGMPASGRSCRVCG
jgi:uracil-DNA glycosylase